MLEDGRVDGVRRSHLLPVLTGTSGSLQYLVEDAIPQGIDVAVVLVREKSASHTLVFLLEQVDYFALHVV